MLISMKRVILGGVKSKIKKKPRKSLAGALEVLKAKKFVCIKLW